MKLLAHLTLAGGLIWWASTDVDPLICMAAYAFGILFIDGPRRSV